MTDSSDEGGDPACWAHLFEDEEDAGDDRPSDVAAHAENAAASEADD